MPATHALHLASSYRPIKSVRDVPVSLVGTIELTDEDRETVEAALAPVIAQAAPKVVNVVYRWRPSGRTVDVWADGPRPYPGSTAPVRRTPRIKLATVAVRSL